MTIDRVNQAMSLNNSQERRRAVDAMRKEALCVKVNAQKIMKNEEPIRTRMTKKPKGYTVICKTCSGFFVSGSSQYCPGKMDTHKVSPKVENSLSRDAFESTVLLNFRDDDVRKIARTDYAVLALGRSIFKGDPEDKKKVMAPMRLLSRIIKNCRGDYRDINSSNVSGEEMLQPANRTLLHDAIIKEKSKEEPDLTTSQVLKQTISPPP
jgi:hypothetical protein